MWGNEKLNEYRWVAPDATSQPKMKKELCKRNSWLVTRNCIYESGLPNRESTLSILYGCAERAECIFTSQIETSLVYLQRKLKSEDNGSPSTTQQLSSSSC